MTKQSISVGTVANDGTGDTLRSAGNKINSNFDEIYSALGGDGVNLSSQISLTNSGIVFEGATADDFETTLSAANVSEDISIALPEASGTLIVDTATQTVTNKTFGKVAFSTERINTSGETLDSNSTYHILNKSSSPFSLILGDGSVSGEVKYITNTGTQTALIQPTNFSQGSFFSIASNESVMCIWDSDNWNIIGNQSVVSIT